MPQQIPTGTLDKFRALDPEKRKIALSRMSDQAKQALLTEINAAKTTATTAPNDHTTIRNTGPAPDPRTGAEVAYDQTLAIPSGTPGIVTGIPGAIAGAGKLVYDTITGNAQSAAETGIGMAKSALEPITTPIRGGIALADAMGLKPAIRGALTVADPSGASRRIMDASTTPTPQEFESAASNLGAEITGAALGKLGAKVNEPFAARRAVAADAANTARSTNSLAVLSSPGVKAAGRDVRFVAESTAPWLRKAFDKVGINPSNIPTSGSTKNAPTGALTVGGTMEDIDKLVKYKNAKLKPGETTIKASDIKSIPLEMADIMVDEIHAPIESAVKQFDKVAAPQLIDKIASDLHAMGQSALDAGQMNLYFKLSEKVRNAKTVGDIMELKVFANKKAAPIFDKRSPSAAAEATAQSSFAYRDLGDVIRAETYPWLESRGVKGMIEQGRLEADALDIKDGIYLTHALATRAEAVSALESWVSKYGTDAVRSSYFAKAALMDTVRKALSKNPQAEFNTLIRDAASIRPRGGLKSNVTVSNPNIADESPLSAGGGIAARPKYGTPK